MDNTRSGRGLEIRNYKVLARGEAIGFEVLLCTQDDERFFVLSRAKSWKGVQPRFTTDSLREGLETLIAVGAKPVAEEHNLDSEDSIWIESGIAPNKSQHADLMAKLGVVYMTL